MIDGLDPSVYPDREVPSALSSDADRADYLSRICAAWDYGIVPLPATFAMLSGWRRIFDAYPIDDSPAYQAFRAYFGWPHMPGRIFKARYEIADDYEGRTDPCAEIF